MEVLPLSLLPPCVSFYIPIHCRHFLFHCLFLFLDILPSSHSVMVKVLNIKNYYTVDTDCEENAESAVEISENNRYHKQTDLERNSLLTFN